MDGHVALSMIRSQEQTLGVARQTLPDSLGQSVPLLSARVFHTRTRAPAVKGVEQLCKFNSSSPHLCCKSRKFPAEADEKSDERSRFCAAMKPTHVAPLNCEPARGEAQWKHQE